VKRVEWCKEVVKGLDCEFGVMRLKLEREREREGKSVRVHCCRTFVCGKVKRVVFAADCWSCSGIPNSSVGLCGSGRPNKRRRVAMLKKMQIPLIATRSNSNVNGIERERERERCKLIGWLVGWTK
jgi:hypothetical protein